MDTDKCSPHHSPLEGAGCEHGDHDHDAGHLHVVRGAAAHRPRQRRALVLCIALTLAMMVGEILAGFWTGSLMLLSDAAHMASHAIALFVSYVALRLATAEYRGRSHYGLYRTEILGAFVNGIGVLVLTAFIAWEAIERLADPPGIAAAEMTAVAALGLVVNLVTAVILGRAGAEDLNTRSAFVHMLGDTLSSVAIVAGGAVLWATDWTWIDPALSILVAVVILVWGVGLVRRSVSILLELAPPDADPAEVRRALVDGVPEVVDVHDLHVWEITSGYRCLTAHVVVEDRPVSETGPIHASVERIARERFRVGHVTLQLEIQA